MNITNETACIRMAKRLSHTIHKLWSLDNPLSNNEKGIISSYLESTVAAIKCSPEKVTCSYDENGVGYITRIPGVMSPVEKLAVTHEKIVMERTDSYKHGNFTRQIFCYAIPLRFQVPKYFDM